ncbi:MAG: hypothetical protein HXX20_15915 [Chloroflexi bacterium]|nr:hypothetical protein [Chloroflexota bacterium]
MIDMNIEHYIIAFGKLKVDRTGGWTDDTNNGAPYKPILLLVVIDLIEQSEIKSNLIELTSELVDLYRVYCRQVLTSSRVPASIALPFFHLKSDKFWELVPQLGKEAVLIPTLY